MFLAVVLMTTTAINAYLVGKSATSPFLKSSSSSSASSCSFLQLSTQSKQMSCTTTTMLKSSEDGKNTDVDEEISSSDDDKENDTTTAAAEENDEDQEQQEEEEEEEEEEEVKEDPEVTKLKEEIAELESTLKRKKQQVREAKDTADIYTKSGYARKVAEMENMRRLRSMMQSSDKSAVSANVLSEFLPVLEQLNSIKEKYEGDEFAKQYGALPGAFKACFTQLGVTDYTLSVGDKIDPMRMIVIESEHSNDIPKDTVLRPVKMGMELQGNVVQMAECVSSLGPEVVEEEKTEEEEGEEEDKEVKAEAEAEEDADNNDEKEKEE